MEKSSKLFSNVRRKNLITENENSYFKFNFKKVTNLGKLSPLPEIHRVFARYLDDQSFPTAKSLPKKF